MVEKQDGNLPGGDVSGQANKPMSRPAHALTCEQLIHELDSNALNGLSNNVAKQRLEELGRNELGDSEGVHPWKIIVAQIANAMTMVCLSTSYSVYITLTLPYTHLLTYSSGAYHGYGS